MRRLFQWLDLGHLVSRAAQTAAAVVCLGVVSGAVLDAMTTPDPVTPVRKYAPMTAYAPSHGRDLAGAFSGDSSLIENAAQTASILMPAPGVPMDVDTPLVRVKASVMEQEPVMRM